MTRRLLLLGLVLGLISGCSWLGGSKDSSVNPPAELTKFTPTVKLARLWKKKVGKGTGEKLLNLVLGVDETRVFAADHTGYVLSLDALTGKKIWHAKTGVPISSGPGLGPGMLVFGTGDGEVIALERADGEVRWRVPATSEVLSVPRIDQGVAAVQTVGGDVLALNTEDGKRAWIYDRTVPVLTLRGTSSPALARGAVIGGFASGKLSAIDLQRGRMLWETSVAVPRGRSELERMVDIDGDPVIRDDIVYVGTYQGSVAALTLNRGQVIWNRDMSSSAGIGVDSSLVFVTDSESQIWALSRRQGASVWRQDGLKGRKLTAPVPFGGYVVVGDFEGYLHLLSVSDGELAARVRVDSDGFQVPPVVVSDTLYAMGKSGTIMAFQLK